jgi:hypothetical protein
MTTATIPSGSALARTKYANDVLRGFLEKNPLAPLFSPPGMQSPIVTKRTTIGQGMSEQFNFVGDGSLDSWRVGDTQLSGQGETLDLAVDTLTYSRKRTATRLDNITESALRTGVNLPETAKIHLQRKGMSKVGYDLLTAACDATVGRTSNRWLYGSSESNYNATHATALANVDSTDDKMRLEIVDLLVKKAKTQTSGSNYMQPAAIKRQDGTVAYKWLMLLHTNAAFDLKKDNDFKNHVLRDKPAFNVLNGGQYIGEWNDVLMYEVPSFFVPTTANPNPMIAAAAGNGGIDVAINLFFGANALGFGVGNVELFEDGSNLIAKTTADTDGSVRMVLTREVGDHGGNAEMGATIVTANKKLVDSTSGTNEAVGVINFATSAA